MDVEYGYYRISIDIISTTNINEKTLMERPFWFAASTHSGEEDLCIKTHLSLKEKFKNILTIIAPRHIQRSQDIKKICDKFHLDAQKTSSK